MLTTKTLIAGLGLVALGVALLMYGPAEHNQWGGLIILAGIGVLGAKPAYNAITPNKSHKEKP